MRSDIRRDIALEISKTGRLKEQERRHVKII